MPSRRRPIRPLSPIASSSRRAAQTGARTEITPGTRTSATAKQAISASEQVERRPTKRSMKVAAAAPPARPVRRRTS